MTNPNPLSAALQPPLGEAADNGPALRADRREDRRARAALFGMFSIIFAFAFADMLDRAEVEARSHGH